LIHQQFSKQSCKLYTWQTGLVFHVGSAARCPRFCTPYILPLTHSITMFSLVHYNIAYSQSDTACCVYMQLQTLDRNFNALLGGWAAPPRPVIYSRSLPGSPCMIAITQQSARCIPAACSSSLSPRTLGGGRRPRMTALTCRPCSVDLIFITAALGAVRRV